MVSGENAIRKQLLNNNDFIIGQEVYDVRIMMSEQIDEKRFLALNHIAVWTGARYRQSESVFVSCRKRNGEIICSILTHDKKKHLPGEVMIIKNADRKRKHLLRN